MSFHLRRIHQFRWKFKKTIRKNHPYEIERAKILLQYFIVICFSVLLGALLSRYLSPLFLHERAIKHFSSPFLHCSDLIDWVEKLLWYSLSDLICLAFSFFSVFTFFHYFASDLILLYQGLILGCLLTTLPQLSSFCHDGELFLLALFRVWITSCLLLHSYQIALCLYQSNRTKFFDKTLGTITIFTITASGIIVFSTAIYCGLIYII
ncbi:MAG: hypothetical protein J6Q82_08090 [Clostridia bacterium]|nr:hypothetical protein [Clostridia bacterium]